MSEKENEPEYDVERDPIPGVDMPVWAEEMILFCGRILVRRFLFKTS